MWSIELQCRRLEAVEPEDAEFVLRFERGFVEATIGMALVTPDLRWRRVNGHQSGDPGEQGS